MAMGLHKRHSQVGTLDEWGEIRELRIEHNGDSREMETFLDGLEAGGRIAVEATSNWWLWSTWRRSTGTKWFYRIRRRRG